mmetsp:Transcript_13613/g.16205  ORF Transcript_13613/g.16205 Transcript_13613/m.16205 type:complete len:99 (+) Transcript_13613:82-378(+)
MSYTPNWPQSHPPALNDAWFSSLELTDDTLTEMEDEYKNMMLAVQNTKLGNAQFQQCEKGEDDEGDEETADDDMEDGDDDDDDDDAVDFDRNADFSND